MAAPRAKTSKSAQRKDISAQLQKIFERVKREHTKQTRAKLPKYEDHVVCFMDLMGFRRRVEKMSVAESRKEIRKLESVVRTVVQPSSFDNDHLFKITANYFSDCVCFACHIGTVDLKWVVEKLFYFMIHILHVQGELIFHDVLVRGAVTVDKHYSSEHIIFSRAQIRAYDLESRHVVFPMVLIDDSVTKALLRASKRKQKKPYPWGMAAIESEIKDLFGLWAQDEHGRRFVNYLGFWRELDSEYDIRPFFDRHKRIVENGARTHKAKPDLLAKYRWMARYHDAYAAKMFPDDETMRIDPAVFGQISLPGEDD